MATGRIRRTARRGAVSLLLACLAVVATGIVIAHHDKFSEPRDLRDVDRREADPLARRGLIAPEVLGVAWVVGPTTPDTARLRQAGETIAAIAHANQLDLYTRNADDFAGLEQLIRVLPV